MKLKNLARDIFSVGRWTLLSRLLGLVQDFLQARYFGAGAESDAFFVSFRLPNFLRRMFADGIIAPSHIPVMSSLLSQDEKKRVNGLATFSSIVFMGILSLVSVLVYLYPLKIMYFLAPGLKPEQREYVQVFLPIMFPFIIFISGSAIFSSVLRASYRFFSTAIGPTQYHLVMIFFLYLAFKLGFSSSFLAYGVVLSGAVQLLTRLVNYFRAGNTVILPSSQSIKDFGTVLYRSWPLFLGLGVVETNIVVESIIGSFLPQGDISLLHYAYRIYYIPHSVCVVPLSVVLFTYFSRVAGNKNESSKLEIANGLLETAKLLFFVLIPTTIFMCLVSPSLYGLFFVNILTPDRVAYTAKLLSILSVGLFFSVLNRMVSKAFYALGDTKVPTAVNALATIANSVGNYVGLIFFGAIGIVCSTTLSILISTPVLFFFLQRRHRVPFLWDQFFVFMKKFNVQLLAMAIPVLILGFAGRYFVKSMAFKSAMFGQTVLFSYFCFLFILFLTALFLFRSWFETENKLL